MLASQPRLLPEIEPVGLSAPPKPFLSYTRALPVESEPTVDPASVPEDLQIPATPDRPRRASLRSVLRRHPTITKAAVPPSPTNAPSPTTKYIQRRPSISSFWRSRESFENPSGQSTWEIDRDPAPTIHPSRDRILGMNITWGEPRTARKLHKKKSVRFTPSTRGDSDADLDLGVSPFDLGPVTAPEPALTTPTPIQMPLKKSSFLPRFRARSPAFPAPAPELKLVDPPSPVESTGSEQSWHHHDSYFPEYVSVLPEASVAMTAIDHSTGRYFPEYTPMYTSPQVYPLAQVQQLAQQHSTMLGHAVSVHYPDLPRFAEYQTIGKASWTSVDGSRGMDGWSGYGYQGETLTLDGATFSAPMPPGQPLHGPQGGSKQGPKQLPQPKVKGPGPGGGAGDTGDNKAEDGGDDGGEAGEAGGGQVAGGKKKKKGKK